MADFDYTDLFPLGEDTTEYEHLGSDGVEVVDLAGTEFLRVSDEALRELTATAIRNISHLLRSSHLQQLANILDDPEASANDRFVARELLVNANIAAGFVLPGHQLDHLARGLGRLMQQQHRRAAAGAPVMHLARPPAAVDGDEMARHGCGHDAQLTAPRCPRLAARRASA